MSVLAVVGVDGGPRGREAIVLARSLNSSPPLLVHIRVIEPGNISAAFDPSGERESAQLLDQERAQACPQAGTLSIVAPGVAAGLHRVATSRGADLLVLGGAGDGALSCLNHAPCATVVASGAHRPGPPRRIGVGSEGSAQGQVAVAYAERLAAELGAELTVYSSDLDPGPDLSEFSHGLDLLVCGSRPDGIMRRVQLGQTSRYLAGHCACPLLVVPAGVAAPVRLSA